MMEMMEKAGSKDSNEDHNGITMECNFNLNYVGTNKEQLVMLPEKDCIHWGRKTFQ